MTFPAVILCDATLHGHRVAGLTVLDRLVVAARRAGADNITIVSEKPIPSACLKRSRALGVKVEQLPARPVIAQPTLVLSNRVLAQASDLKRVFEQRGTLLSRDGLRLPIGVLSLFSENTLETDLATLPSVTAIGVAEFVVDATSARRATQRLWTAMNSSADGLVDRYFNRPLGRFISKLLVHTPVSPNQVSVVATILGVLSAFFMARGDYVAVLFGAALFQFSAIVDCVDGELARILFKESPLGKWLDIIGDQVVHIAVFLGVGVGLFRAHADAPVLALASIAAIGVVISFGVVMAGQARPAALRNARLQKLIDATTNRDFSVVLLALAACNRLPWFLWMAAIGVHVFWVVALVVQWIGSRDEHLKSARESRC
ncbi:MAG TPA: CDP-alcohol phosphatidyltransferase family protein [Opitutaceae bacterium]|nr:CDP-alcohol phosphatidyltransferase family protein [Opitutaceae bacterium]